MGFLKLLAQLLLAFSVALYSSPHPFVLSAGFQTTLGQLNTFNATPGTTYYNEAFSILAHGGLDNATFKSVLEAVTFERSNWAGASVYEDAFYRAPINSSSLPPGAVLEVERQTNTSLYTLPAAVTLSRFLYNTKTLNGTTVPASAFVLWPFQSRSFANLDGYPVVAWAHGTSGTSAEAAPSHIRNLWYQYSAPFTLALAGYVVVAADYAGLGVDRDPLSGALIPHQYAAHPAAANDMRYAVQAAQAAWPNLTREFVVMGHSQGGGAAWAFAQQQAIDPVPGYLGSVAASPFISLYSIAAQPLDTLPALLSLISQGLPSVFPDFSPAVWLTATGVSRLGMYLALNGSQSTASTLLSDTSLIRPDWTHAADYLYAFANLTSNGGKPFKGPMLVLQGTADPLVPEPTTSQTVQQTCSLGLNESLEYEKFHGVSHVPVMYAGQQTWLGWIAERFQGVETPALCRERQHNATFNDAVYQHEIGYFLEYPTAAYETA